MHAALFLPSLHLYPHMHPPLFGSDACMNGCRGAAIWWRVLAHKGHESKPADGDLLQYITTNRVNPFHVRLARVHQVHIRKTEGIISVVCNNLYIQQLNVCSFSTVSAARKIGQLHPRGLYLSPSLFLSLLPSVTHLAPCGCERDFGLGHEQL